MQNRLCFVFCLNKLISFVMYGNKNMQCIKRKSNHKSGHDKGEKEAQHADTRDRINFVAATGNCGFSAAALSFIATPMR